MYDGLSPLHPPLTCLLLKHGGHLLLDLRIAQHPLDAGGIPHGLRKVRVEHLLHLGIAKHRLHHVHHVLSCRGKGQASLLAAFA